MKSTGWTSGTQLSVGIFKQMINFQLRKAWKVHSRHSIPYSYCTCLYMWKKDKKYWSLNFFLVHWLCESHLSSNISAFRLCYFTFNKSCSILAVWFCKKLLFYFRFQTENNGLETKMLNVLVVDKTFEHTFSWYNLPESVFM